jgi:hypothetical protein
MGFLDKLFGRAKETGGDVADKAAPAVDKAQDSAGQAWDKGTDVAGDAAEEVKDTVSDLAHRGDEAAEHAAGQDAGSEPDTTGSGPTAA